MISTNAILEPVCVLGRGSDGMLLAHSLSEFERDTSTNELRPVLRNAALLLRNQNEMLPDVLSIESGPNVFHYEKGADVSCFLITDQSYSTTEAFSRIAHIKQLFLSTHSTAMINESHMGFEEFDVKTLLTVPLADELPLSPKHQRGNIAPILEKIKGTSFGFSSRILEKKKSQVPELSWEEIGLLVPMTILAFGKTIAALRTGHLLDVTTNLMSTAVAFYLVFICVHKLLTIKKLFLASFALLLLTYGTTLDSLTSIVFNGVFALITLCNVAHYYLKPVEKTKRAQA